jgi:tRNA 5-methylaminomethyl-2-thiouridine biosynthesis bifunctional protein
MWDSYTLKAVARCCRRGTRLATWTVARDVRDSLAQCGFRVQMVAGLPPKRDRLQATFDPSWEPKKSAPMAAQPAIAGRCIVVGSGLAGAAVAASLARRGWQVTVLDAADHPAAGASGLPAGLVVPHVSADDSVLSRLCRAGARATWHQVRTLLREDEDYALTGVAERQLDAIPPEPDHWHAHAGWLKPAQLVLALLAQPGITWQGNARVQQFQRQGEYWQLLDAQGQLLAQAPQVVVCAGFASHALLQQALPLQALRGQLSWGWRDPAGLDAADFPATPVNGGGNFIPAVPTPQGLAWYLGSSFGRDDTDPTPRDTDHASNWLRLQALLPQTARALAPQFVAGATPTVQAFAAVRCTAPDRVPVVGAVENRPGLWVSTAMGARGLTLAVLCGELLAAQWHGEPLPLELKLAQALSSGRKGLARKAMVPA